MIKETFELASERQSMSVSMAPILGAFGEDYKDIEFEARIRKERASALFELIDTLDRTEKERIELNLKKKSRQKGLAQKIQPARSFSTAFHLTRTLIPAHLRSVLERSGFHTKTN